MKEHARRLAVAEKVLTEAAGLALDFFERRAELALQEKAASEFVSEADREVESLIRARIASYFPGDDIVGEEMGGAPAQAFWSVDPIDGTANFLRGSPLWGMSLGYVVNGEPVAGVIGYPVLGLTLGAAKGLGVLRNGQPFERRVPFPDVRITSVGESPHWPPDAIAVIERSLRRAGWGIAEYRCATIGLGFAALGHTDGYIEKGLSIWDMAAGAVICAEAGLDVRFGGSFATAGMWIVAALPEVHRALAPDTANWPAAMATSRPG